MSDAEFEKRIRSSYPEHPFLVADRDGELLAYAYSHRFKSREAYKNSSEVSVYVKNDAKEKGIGTALYDILLPTIFSSSIHAVIAGIALPNDASIRLHEKYGFDKVAHFKEVGFKHGRWVDVGSLDQLGKIRRGHEEF